MKINSATNPEFANADSTAIKLTIDTDKFGVIPFTATSNDVEAHGRDLFARALAGEFGPVAVFVPRAPTQYEIDAAALATEKQAVKNLPRVQAFVAKSRADIKAEIQAANLAALKDVVEDVAIIVHILAKREFK